MELINNPTQALLDDHLLKLSDKSESYGVIKAEYITNKYNLEVLIANEQNKTDDNGKPVHKTKVAAEAHAKQEYSELDKKVNDLKAMEAKTSIEFDMLKMQYYHARNKLGQNDMIDAQASIMGSKQDLPY